MQSDLNPIDLKSLSDAYRSVLISVGEDPNREGLLSTPERAAKSMAYFCKGYSMSLKDTSIISGLFKTEDLTNDIIIVRNIDFFSMCEHHMIPFYGHVTIGYISSGKILGLSKFARIVEMFTRRFQLQERLTNQIAQAIQEVLQPKGVVVLVNAEHLCMVMRGVQKMDCSTITTCSLGCMKIDSENKRFMNLLKM